MKRWMIALVVGVLGLMAVGGVALAAGPADGPRQGAVRERVARVADLLGMEPRSVAQALRGGQSVAELAEAQGVELAEIEAALSAEREARLADAVAAGRLSEAQADFLTERADERLDDFLTLPPRRALRQPQLEAFAEALGLSAEEVTAAIAGGQRPAALIEAQGLTVAGVVEAMMGQREAALAELVALDLMTETQKGLALHRYEQRLTARFSGEAAAFGERAP